jgi:hypothetical protein
MHRKKAVGVAVILCSWIVGAWAHTTPAAEVVRLNEKNWDSYAPQGKEADAIYGDYVLRNDKIVCVIADAIPSRNANMTVRNVGGAIIDLTRRDEPNDQLSCYYPGAAQHPLRLLEVGHRSSDGAARALNFVAGNVGDREISFRDFEVHLQCESKAEPDKPRFYVTYRLRDGWDYVEVTTSYHNTTEKPVEVELLDAMRADRTFERSLGKVEGSVWFYDKFFRQAYGVWSHKLKLGTFVPPSTATAARRYGVFLRLIDGDSHVVMVPAGGTRECVRRVFPAESLFTLKQLEANFKGENLVNVRLCAEDKDFETIPNVEVSALGGAKFDERYGHGYTAADGTLRFALPRGRYRLEVSHQAREKKTLEVDTDKSTDYTVTLADPGYVVGKITSASGGPIPCKVAFLGIEPTKDPDFGPDSGHTAVKNLVYTHNGRFKQEIPPGKYRVVISYGPEYDAVFKEIEVEHDKDTPLIATLVRTVDTAGWVSADFHNHASPSGDNTSSQFGRVQNILCEHIEFAPCTEHNRIDTYVPHLKKMGVEHLMATCCGIELTGQPLPINHQNAFPLVFRPHLQDGGAPQTDEDPETQISRLALWDGRSEKLVQQNHPDIGWLFFDRDGDGVPDGGFKKSVPFMDVIEIHPLEWLLKGPVVYWEDRTTKQQRSDNNRIFNWLQILNQGHRITGVVNTDSHYNFHESGFWRNYLKSPTDDPAKIETLDMVHAAERGNVIMTTAPFLEVKLIADETGVKSQPRAATAGDDITITSGRAKLHIRVQCANWYDIDRVQVYLNGRPANELNISRFSTPERFGKGSVKFDQTLPLELKQDTHVIVMAVGEKSTLGIVQGPTWGKILPIAVSNPIYVDVDGGGFTANRDTLGAPLPVKGGQPAEKQKKKE